MLGGCLVNETVKAKFQFFIEFSIIRLSERLGSYYPVGLFIGNVVS